MTISYHPIGTIRSPFDSIEGVPIQPTAAAGIRGSIEILPQYSEGLQDLDGFSHVILLYHLHRVREMRLMVTPFLDTQPRGVFATRAPTRPNPIGLSVVRLLNIKEDTLYIENVDIVDGTPLLDIKPYVPEFDQHPGERIGWLAQAQGRIQGKKSDTRFR